LPASAKGVLLDPPFCPNTDRRGGPLSVCRGGAYIERIPQVRYENEGVI